MVFLEDSAPALPKNLGASEDMLFSFVNLRRVGLLPDRKISAQKSHALRFVAQ
jgi:hypothetical protein